MIELLNMDCMDYLREQPDKSFDLACVDPPYGKKPSRGGIGTCKRNFTQNDNHWDIKPENEWFSELIRVSENQIIWGANHLIENLTDTNCFIVWDKNNESSLMADCELAWTSFKTVTKIVRYTWNGMIQGDMKNKEKRIHPTQKPVKLYDWQLRNYAEPGQRILDTHLGSGSSAIAAHYFGVDFVGIEIDEDYYNAACNRFNNETRQIALI